MEVHLAPPILGRKDDKGHPKKTTFGPWMFKAFGLLARFKFLRGTPLDIFGYSEERSTERKLIADYEAMIDEILEDFRRRSTRLPWRWRAFRKKFAASAMSRRATSCRPRQKKRISSQNSAARRRPCRSRRNDNAP
jgi:hypothetical protein